MPDGMPAGHGMMERLAIVLLTAVLAALQYQLWLGEDSIPELRQLHQAVAEQARENDALQQRNEALEAEVRNLRRGLDAVEARARSELGMIRRGETFYRVVDSGSDARD